MLLVLLLVMVYNIMGLQDNHLELHTSDYKDGYAAGAAACHDRQHLELDPNLNP